MKDELDGEIIKDFVGLRKMKMKKQKIQKSVIKRKNRFQDDKTCLKAASTGNKINHLEKTKIDVDSLKEDKKNDKNNKLILKTQQHFKRERHNVFTE